VLLLALFPLSVHALEPSGAGPRGLEVHGCTFETADDRTGENLIDLEWRLTHAICMIVRVGTTVRWNGNFSAHPLAGGVTPVVDASSPVTTASINGSVASVTFNDPGDYPYFCTVHLLNMAGVIYVVPAPLSETPLQQLHSETGSIDYFINGVALAVDTNSNGSVDSMALPATIEVGALDLPPGAGLERAFLWWGGSQDQPSALVPGEPDDTISLQVPGAAAAELVADTCFGSDAGAGSYDVFACRADITSRINSAGGVMSGSYVIDGYAGLVEDGGSNSASAALVLLYSDASLPQKKVIVHDGLMTLQSNSEIIDVTGFDAHGLGESLAWYTMEGDTGGTGSESVSVKGLPGNVDMVLSGPVNPADNPMNHTINTLSPPDTDSISLDVDRFDITLSAADTSAEITYSAGTDKWWLVVNVLGVGQPASPVILLDGFEDKGQGQ
jgi:hypothetical protein